jgi:putative colanic acid biosynthesis UDP-glucose lipid carrier transferase
MAFSSPTIFEDASEALSFFERIAYSAIDESPRQMIIRSREIGLFNAYSLTMAGVVTLWFWGCLVGMSVLDLRPLLQNMEPYLAYNLISVGGLLLQLYQTDLGRLNLVRMEAVQNARLSISQTLHVAGALALMLVLTKDLTISRLFLLVYLAILPFVLFLANAMVPKLLGRMFFGGKNLLPSLVIGRLQRAPKLRRWLRRIEAYGVHIIGFLTDDEFGNLETEGGPVPVVGHARELNGILGKIRIDTVILLDLPKEQSLLDEIVDNCIRAGVRLVAINPLPERFKHSLRFYRQFGMDFIALRQEPLQDPLNRIIKRTIDIVVALFAVVFILPPLTLAVWIAHRTQSPGPLFFRQTRAGIQNRPFQIFKFRTMTVSNPNEARQATEADDRIFPFGRIMRKCSIDEIPQFLNVLLGDMSVVGPRPHMLEHNEQFAKVMAGYHVRTFIKPGLTGLAQVQGYRGEAHTPDDIRKRVACDVDYIERWSALLDVAIILQTAWQVVRPPRSAY